VSLSEYELITRALEQRKDTRNRFIVITPDGQVLDEGSCIYDAKDAMYKNKAVLVRATLAGAIVADRADQ